MIWTFKSSSSKLLILDYYTIVILLYPSYFRKYLNSIILINISNFYIII